MKILEDVMEVHVIPNGSDPDDLAFGRVKPVKSFPYDERFPKGAFDQAEAFIEGYNYRLGELTRN